MARNPVLTVLATQPALVAEHAEAYAKLLGADLTQLWVSAKRRAYLDAFALCGFFMAFVFAGVSTMLWAIHPRETGGSIWLLLFVPVFPAVLAIGCMVSRRPYDLRDLERTRSQFQADLAMLREIPPR